MSQPAGSRERASGRRARHEPSGTACRRRSSSARGSVSAAGTPSRRRGSGPAARRLKRVAAAAPTSLAKMRHADQRVRARVPRAAGNEPVALEAAEDGKNEKTTPVKTRSDDAGRSPGETPAKRRSRRLRSPLRRPVAAFRRRLRSRRREPPQRTPGSPRDAKPREGGEGRETRRDAGGKHAVAPREATRHPRDDVASEETPRACTRRRVLSNLSAVCETLSPCRSIALSLSSPYRSYRFIAPIAYKAPM